MEVNRSKVMKSWQWAARTTVRTIPLVFLILGAAGLFPGASGKAIGWTAIGLGSGAFVINLIAGDHRDPKERVSIIFNAIALPAFIALGALGVTGAYSTGALGIRLLGTSLILGMLSISAAKP